MSCAHLQNQNKYAIVSPEGGPLARFSSLKPAAYRMDRGLTTEHPPVAGHPGKRLPGARPSEER